MPSSFGQRLKAARVIAGLSMDALVAKMGHKVSKQAIMYRARQEEIIFEYAYESFSREISARNWRKQEPYHNTPHLSNAVVFFIIYYYESQD